MRCDDRLAVCVFLVVEVLAGAALTFEGVALVAAVLEVCAVDTVAAARTALPASHNIAIRFRFILNATKKPALKMISDRAFQCQPNRMELGYGRVPAKKMVPLP